VSGTGGPATENVVAVIVTLEPQVSLIRHAESLASQVRRIVVVDNGSGPGATSILDSLAALPSVEVIRNPANEGIGCALNQGAEAATAAGAAWLLTLDQDAAPSPDIVRIAASTFDSYPDSDRIAVIGSTSEADLGRPSSAASRGRPWVEARTVITAGSFVSLAALRRIGDFREDFFIDYVDIELCLRARAKGFRILESGTVAMTHQIGQPTVRRIGRRIVTPSNHSPGRRYYMTRNRFLVWRRYWRTEPRFVAMDFVASQKELVKLLLFEEQRTSKVRAALLGLRDGLCGRAGRAPFGQRSAPTDSSSRRRAR
jgi:rhamnosyltransferase